MNSLPIEILVLRFCLGENTIVRWAFEFNMFVVPKGFCQKHSVVIQ